MDDIIEITLYSLKEYLIFLYPGFITIYIFKYVDGKKIEETKLLVVKSIIVSYIYLLILSPILGFTIDSSVSSSLKVHYWAIVMSVLIPLVIYCLISSEKFNIFQKKIGIQTRRDSNPIDIALTIEKCPLVSVYMDEYGVMYEGEVRNYVKDPDRSDYIMLSGYRVWRLFETEDSEGNVIAKEYKQIYPKPRSSEDKSDTRHNEWVILYSKDITRIEVLYNYNHV